MKKLLRDQEPQSKLKDIIVLTVITCLFWSPTYSIYAQASESATIDTAQESQVKTNQDQHSNNDALIASQGAESKCSTGLGSTEDNREAQREYRLNMMSQGFDEVNQIFTDVEAKRAELDGRTGSVNSATDGVNAADPAQATNHATQKKLEAELAAMNSKIDAQKQVIQAIEARIRTIYNRSDDYMTSDDRKVLKKLKAEKFKEDAILQQLYVRKNHLKYKVKTNATVDGANAVKNADKAVAKARQEAAPQEGAYRDLLALIKAQEGKADENLRIAEERIAEVQQESEHNADFLIFERAKSAPDEKTESGRNAISNLEILSMASAGMTTLKCVDFSRVKSRAYPLFKAASATYIANHLNSTSEYTKVTKGCILKCVSLEAIKADQSLSSDQKQYPQFQNLKIENATANCKTDDGQDGLFENDHVASDDEDEQYASIERMAQLYRKLAEFTEVKISNQQDALKLFKSAHAAAIMEVTSKLSLTAAAEAQLAKAEAEKKKAENSIKIYLTILAITVAANAVCPGCCGCISWKVQAVIALLALFGNDLKQAIADIKKWKNELQEARIHTHMMCNYPGDDANFEMLTRPETIPLIYPKSKIMQQVTAQVSHPEFESKSKIATTIEWIRNLQGANQSLAYDERIPTKIEMLGLLQRVGLYLKDSSENIGDKLTDVMFPNVHAVNLESGIGLHDQSGSFKQYLNMKVGAWRLQSFNASLKVDLRKNPVTIEHLYPNQPMMLGFRKYMQKNSPEVYGKRIEQTGFPLPETRAAYLKSVVDMLTQNLEFNANGLASIQAINNQYAELLRRASEAMEVSSGITDADVTVEKAPNVCTSGSGDGTMSVDESCACKSANTCTSFKMPDFGSFSAGDLSSNSQFLIDGANSFANGDAAGGKTSFGKMSDSSSAISDMSKKLSSFKISIPKDSSGSDNNKNSGSSNSSGAAKVSKSKSSSGDGQSSNALNSKSSNKFANQNDQDEENKDSNESSSADGKALSSSKKSGATNAVTSSSAKSKKVKGDSFNINEVNFDDLDSEDVSEADIDLSALNRMRMQERQRNSSINGGASSGAQTYIGADGQVYKNTDGINLNSKGSIFQILSKRYKMSAMPVLLKKQKK